MLGYSRSSNLKTPNKFGEDSLQNTLCETNAFQDSTYRTNFFGQSPMNHDKTKTKMKANIAFSRAKTMVDTLLQEIQDKKNMNNEILLDISNINAQAVQEVSRWPDYETMNTNQKKKKILINSTIQEFPKNNNNIQNNLNERNWTTENSRQNHNIYFQRKQQRPTTKVYELSASLEIERLQKIIKQQVRNNQYLQHKCNSLQTENRKLKESKTGMDYLAEQFEQLKRQNQNLRQDTLKLLQKIR